MNREAAILEWAEQRGVSVESVNRQATKDERKLDAVRRQPREVDGRFSFAHEPTCFCSKCL